MQPLPPDPQPPPDTPLQLWLEAARTLRGLARRQQAALEAEADDLDEILAAKETAYRQADALAQRASRAPTRAVENPLRDAIRAELTALAAIEARSEAILAERLAGIRSELESLRRGQSAAFAYAPAHAASPRFLDQRR